MRRLAAPLTVAATALCVGACGGGSRDPAPARSLVCPGSDPGGLTNPAISLRPGSRTRLVAPGAVSLTVCRYNGGNRSSRSSPLRAGDVAPFALEAIGVTRDRATIARLSRKLDAIGPRAGVGIDCTLDPGNLVVAYFGYRSGPGDVVTAHQYGCRPLTNGRLDRSAVHSNVVGRLAALTRPVRAGPATGCARNDRGVPLVSTLADASRSLIPRGATAVLICQYNGANALGGAPRWGLRASGSSTDPTVIAKLRRTADALKPLPRGAVYVCPMADGSRIIASFSYPTGTDVVSADLGGCGGIGNGYVVRSDLSHAVSTELRALTHPVSARSARTVPAD